MGICSGTSKETHTENLDRIVTWKCWLLRRGENQNTRRKFTRSREPTTNNKNWKKINIVIILIFFNFYAIRKHSSYARDQWRQLFSTLYLYHFSTSWVPKAEKEGVRLTSGICSTCSFPNSLMLRLKILSANSCPLRYRKIMAKVSSYSVKPQFLCGFRRPENKVKVSLRQHVPPACPSRQRGKHSNSSAF